MKMKLLSVQKEKVKNPNRPEPFTSSEFELSSNLSNHKELWTIYKTKDLGEASALITAHCRLINLETEKGFFWFMFDDPETCRKTSDAYWNNTLAVRAKELVDAMRSLKERVFAEKSKQEG
jgi:hypothetical protein